MADQSPEEIHNQNERADDVIASLAKRYIVALGRVKVVAGMAAFASTEFQRESCRGLAKLEITCFQALYRAIEDVALADVRRSYGSDLVGFQKALDAKPPFDPNLGQSVFDAEVQACVASRMKPVEA